MTMPYHSLPSWISVSTLFLCRKIHTITMINPAAIVLVLLLFPISVYVVAYKSQRSQRSPSMASTTLSIPPATLPSRIFSSFLHPADQFEDEDRPRWSPSPEDQLRVRNLLLRKLPPELVLPILSIAKYNSVMSITRTDFVHVRNASVRYLVSDPLPQHGRLEEVRLGVRGRDQGWSSFPQQYGTYVGSSSYYQVCLLRRDLDGHRHSRDQTDWMLEEDNLAVWSEADNSRRTVQYNVHAGQYIKPHHLVFTKDQPDQPLISIARPGDRIALIATAQYLGWENRVSFVLTSSHVQTQVVMDSHPPMSLVCRAARIDIYLSFYDSLSEL